MNELRKTLMIERRQRHLKSLIEEAVVNILAEQQPAPVPPPAPPAVPGPAAPPPMEDPNAPLPEDGNDREGVFTVDDMIERLNVIRGGRSFTDPEVYGQMVTYFKGLDDQQKQDLQTFLVELGKIVINVNQQDQAGGAQAQKQPAQSMAPPPPPAPSQAPAMGGGGMPAPPAG